MAVRPNRTQARKDCWQEALQNLPPEAKARMLASADSGIPLVYHIADGKVGSSFFMNLLEDITLDYIWPTDILKHQKGQQ